MTKRDILFYVIIGLFFIVFLLGFIGLEAKVQNRWDKYEQKVFIEHDISK